TLVNFAEQQSKLVSRAIGGAYQLPPNAQMELTIKADEAAHAGHFYQAARHTMQVDFNRYVADLMQEIKRGEKRAGASVIA
ncbi:MAG: NAD(P)/FAD-dependent oxidoreductase, partial [Pseudomonadota bacterium]